MKNAELYNYVFWYNTYENKWFAIPRDEYSSFFTGNVDRHDFMWSESLDDLVEMVIADNS